MCDICRYTWRIDLSKSEEFWPGWFQGLSEKFLNVRVPKLLLLASIDGLDKTLTVGQMQGVLFNYIIYIYILNSFFLTLAIICKEDEIHYTLLIYFVR